MIYDLHMWEYPVRGLKGFLPLNQKLEDRHVKRPTKWQKSEYAHRRQFSAVREERAGTKEETRYQPDARTGTDKN